VIISLRDKKVPSHDKRTRVAWFEQPIFAVKRVEKDNDKKAYTKTFVSFQSTGVTNISGVNNLLSLTLYVQPQYMGTEKNKFAWATEQNEGREIYLSHYHGVDSKDHMINMTGNRFVSWKYWHSPYLYAMSMGIIVCFNMYLECSEGELDARWKVEEKDRMVFLQLQLKLSEQMLTYDLRNELYAGDIKFRHNTQLPKKRKRSKDLTGEETFPYTGVTLHNLKLARQLPQFCSTIEDIQKHFESICKKTNQYTCEVCGKSPIGDVDCVRYSVVYSTNAIGMVVGVHFYITMISSLGWQGVTTLMCLERVGRMNRGRQRTKSKGTGPMEAIQ
jgi:hypothetical protein